MPSVLSQLMASSGRLMRWLPRPDFEFRRALESTISQAAPLTTIVIDSEHLQLLGGNGNNIYITLDSEVSAARALAAEADGLAPHLRDVRLELRGDMVLQRRLALPQARHTVVRRILTYELPRLVPLKSEQLYFDHVQDAPTLVRIRVVRRDRLDQILRICHTARMRVAEIYCGDDPAPVSPTAFPVDQDALTRLIWRRWGTVILAGFLCVLTILTVVAFYIRGIERQDLVNTRLQIVRHQAVMAAHLRAELVTLNARAHFLTSEKEKPLVIATLAELSRALPDGTWLNEIQFKGMRVRIRGSSTNASDLIARIDSSPFFMRAHFMAPVVHMELGNGEQFELSFELKPT